MNTEINDLPIGSDHIWSEVKTKKIGLEAKPCLFLDRDGVIVEEVHFLHQIQDVRLIEGAANLIKEANEAGYWVVIVTNQSGLARGMFDWQAFKNVQDEMLRQLDYENGAYVDAVYACPFHKIGQDPFNHPDHPDRKPNPGMILRAKADLNLDLPKSFIVGDKASDLKAGLNGGLSKGIHVETGHGSDPGEREKALALKSDIFSVVECRSIKDVQI